MTDECIREKCYCWEVSCKALESRRMRMAVKKGQDPETQRMKSCNFPNSGEDEIEPSKAWLNATRWMRVHNR